MKFFFNSEKATQAAAAFLRFDEERQMSHLRLLKLLYIADRESLKETGRPITGDHVLAMDNGPVLEGVYKLVRGTHYNTPRWSKFLQTSNYRIRLVKDPGLGELSRYELDKLREVFDRYAAKSDWDIVADTHRFEEWKKNHQEATSRPIPVEDILVAVGRAANIAEIVQDEKDRETADRILFGK